MLLLARVESDTFLRASNNTKGPSEQKKQKKLKTDRKGGSEWGGDMQQRAQTGIEPKDSALAHGAKKHFDLIVKYFKCLQHLTQNDRKMISKLNLE